MKKRNISSVILLLVIGIVMGPAIGLSQAADDAKSPPPIRVLLITGGCCHNYALQAKKLVDGSSKIARMQWKVMQDPRKGTKGKIDLYKDPNWAKDYDVVVHNECFAKTTDADYIRQITNAHKAGTPGVVIHCAMHTYRAAKIDDWREFLGVTSTHHEHQSNYTVIPKLKDHPIMKGFPAKWKTPKDELYVIKKMWPNTKALATSKSEKSGQEHAVFWVSQYGKARVFGTTFGHGNATFDDKVYIDTVTRGLLWACDKLGDDGKPKAGYEAASVKNAGDKKGANAAGAAGEGQVKAYLNKLPKSEKAISLFNGKDLTGWEGDEKRWFAENGMIVGRNNDKVATSTYLFTKDSYRNFRMVFEVKQTVSPRHSTMHTAVCALGERFNDKGNAYGFKGPLLMFCHDWGIWDAYRRNRVAPRGAGPKVEKKGDWNLIEILVIGNRIQFAANGTLIFDFTDKPEMLKKSQIGLQLHSNGRPQEHSFRQLYLTRDPEDVLVTLKK